MAKRLTEEEKNKIVADFNLGKSVDELADEYICTKLTITRNLRKNLGEKIFKELIQKAKTKDIDIKRSNENISNNFTNKNFSKEDSGDESLSMNTFIEITPLDYAIENSEQKDLSSIPISEIRFPNIVYLIIDKKTEIETKYLKDYPNWSFLSNDELERKTIEIFEDLKKAKRSCTKEQKVIKVPNTEVFKIVAPILISRGISRIISDDKLIAL